MAPITRSGTSSLAPEGLQPPRPAQRSREASWQFVSQPDERSERALSEEPASSYDEDADMRSDRDEQDDDRQLLLEGPEDHEDILHPLREAADRVGREVEKFAEVLDGYNPQQVENHDDKHEMVLEILDSYHSIAKETVERLRERHDAERRQKAGLRRRTRLRGFEITGDELDLYDEDQEDSPLPDTPTDLADLERWEQETRTWDLLRRLVHLRYQPARESALVDGPVSAPHKYSDGRDLWHHFLETDSLALERKTVLEWLKDTAQEEGEPIDILVEDLQQNADRGDIIAHGWIHTREAVKKEKRSKTWSKALDPAAPEVQNSLMNASKTAPLITQLDPDAPTRQRRKLEVQDQYFERAIWLGCYEMLRRGSSPAEIRDWCEERSQIWRAVSMSGLPDRGTEDEEIADPSSWALWRRMCFALARNGGGAPGDDYERAVYGILSGDVASVERVCGSWDDFVFVHYNALLRSQFDIYLQNLPFQKATPATTFGVFDAVQFHGEPGGAGKRLIETLKNDSRTSQEAAEPMKMLQGVLISGVFKDFIYQQGLTFSKIANSDRRSEVIPKEKMEPDNVYNYIATDDHDSLRVLTHVLLVFMHLGVDLGGSWKETAVENVIVSYITFLRFSAKEELIPLYCSHLKSTRKYAVLSRMLIDVTDYDQRITHISNMRDLGLDVQKFVNLQARYLFSDYPDEEAGYPASTNFKLLDDARTTKSSKLEIKPDFIGEDTRQVPRIDVLLIRSFEWYLLIDGLWTETFEMGTLLYLRFFKHMHLLSAKSLLQKMSSNTIAFRKTRALLGEALDFTSWENEDEDMTEVLDGSADRRRLLKRYLLEQSKPFRELEALIHALDLIETVRSMEIIMIEQQQTTNNRPDPKARQELATICENVDFEMQPFLKNWLLTCPNHTWETEFALLRAAYLPETILAYIKTLQFAGSALTRNFLMQSMDLAATIAEENADVVQLFQATGRMQDLVHAFAEASKTLLLISSEKKGGRSRGKQARISGWQLDLWNIKT